MSYRHSSYRKLKKIARQSEASPGEDFWTRAQRERVRLWGGWSPEPKPFGWGKPKAWRA
jgi:hypothetical protein